MFKSRLDTALLGSLVEMGGEELRLQLLADLSECETGLKALCRSEQGSMTSTASDAARVLHTLRGLAMTIGAAKLAQACVQAEELEVVAGREKLVHCLARVTEESELVRAEINQCPDRSA